jgi:putative endonuclease
MNNIIKFQNIESKLLEIREQKVLLDIDIAELYGVETKRINEAVKNNPDKFPIGYILELSKEELDSLKSKISTLKNKGRGQHSKYLQKAFTEKGLYMLATIFTLCNNMNFYVYILQSTVDNHFYTGYTKNLEERIDQHNAGKVKSTKNRRPLKLVYFEGCLNQQDATHREKYLKTTYGKRYIKNRLKNYLNNK